MIDKALNYIWYPCSDMNNYKKFLPVHIKKAYGSYVETIDGRRIIDAISSWWCKSLGHNHPRLISALIEQASKLEHVMQPHIAHEPVCLLSEKLSSLTNNLKKTFYASDGSTAVEIALKMAIHAQKIKGNIEKTKFVALKNSYHGETIATMSISDIGKFKGPYHQLLFDSYLIENLPYLNDIDDCLWQNCEKNWDKIEQTLEINKARIVAIIVEPIVQGAAGMKIYSQDLLRKLREWTKKNDIFLIADEIMTGIGRTGKLLACEYSNIEPDFLCLSKGLTSGMIPLSVCLTSKEIFDIFYYNDPFLHSNTHFGNAIATRIALEVLNIFEEENILENINKLNLSKNMKEVAKQTDRLENVRSIGAIAAADLVEIDPFEFYKRAMGNGAILRPIGKTIYWLPPLNSDANLIDELKVVTIKTLDSF